MTKTKGFNIRIDAFVALDPKNFTAQAAAFALIGTLQDTKKLTPEFIAAATILDVNAKQGSAELPAVTGEQPDPANVPLTTDPLPEGAVVLESTTDLTGHIFQTIRLVDGAETFRRISAEQDKAETGNIAPQVDDGKAAEVRAAEKKK